MVRDAGGRGRLKVVAGPAAFGQTTRGRVGFCRIALCQIGLDQTRLEQTARGLACLGVGVVA